MINRTHTLTWYENMWSGVLHIIDGLVLILSLGFFVSGFAADYRFIKWRDRQ